MQGAQAATLNPLHGYKNVVDAQFDDAVAALDACEIVKLCTAAVDDVRCCVPQDITATAATRRAAEWIGRHGAPARITSLTESGPAPKRRSPPTSATTRSKSRQPSDSDPSTTHPREGGQVGEKILGSSSP